MSSAAAALIAQITFLVVLVLGRLLDELSGRAVIVMLALWVAGYLALPRLAPGMDLFTTYVAVLDIALVFLVFRGDVRLR